MYRTMKRHSSSGDISMSVERCSCKLRFLILVVNTADFINERATPTLGMTHAISSPIAIFSTYIFMGILILGSTRNEYASQFLQTYALVACSSLHTYLSITVFKELIMSPENNAATVLNGVLPMLIIFILLADLIVILFSTRNDSPVLPQSSEPSHVDITTN